MGAAVGLAVAAALTVPGAASAEPGGSSGPGAIGPGVQISTPVGNGAELCTANFLYSADGESSGKLYLGAAAHCMAGENAMSSINGCVEPVMPEGIEVSLAGRDGRTYTGTVAYNSWAVMQERGETAEDLCLYNDLSLIELSPEAAAVADPTVPGFGGPTALDTDGTRNGETVYSHQPNQLTATPDKQGRSLGQPEGPRTHVVVTVPAGVPGDSGSGYLDADGEAFGLLSSLMLPTGSNGVTDIAQALDYAAEFGSVGSLELVPGTEPFSASGLTTTEAPSGPDAPDAPDSPGLLPELTPVPLR